MADIVEMQQRTDEWFQARLGKATASRIADIVAKTKSGPSASRANYLAELVAERLTGEPAVKFTNAAMQWGNDTEPQARAAYEWHTLESVTEVGFIDHQHIAMSGASPDGLVGRAGLVEIKCPNTATQISTVLGGKIPAKYTTQMQWQMACTGREWCDFVSFDPRLPPHGGQYFRKRIDRDDNLISELEIQVAGFLAEVDETIEKLAEACGGVPKDAAFPDDMPMGA